MNSKPSPTPSIRDRARHWAGKHLPKPSTGCFQKCILAVLRRPVESAQYVSIKYTERLAEAGIEPSVGSVGDSYDNVLAETRSEEHTSELQSLMRISYAVFCLKKKTHK